jgi:hypothetical protein
MIEATNLLNMLGAQAPRTASPATRQSDDFLALLQSELGKPDGNNLGAPETSPIKSVTFGQQSHGYIKPMSLGLPDDWQPPADGQKDTASYVAPPSTADTKPISLGAPDGDAKLPVEEVTKPMSWGAPVEDPTKSLSWDAPTDIEDTSVVAEEGAADLDMEAIQHDPPVDAKPSA